MSNLPPGVTDSMIPGNRLEDFLYDRAIEALVDLASTFGACVSEDATDDELQALDELTEAFLSFVHRFRWGVE